MVDIMRKAEFQHHQKCCRCCWITVISIPLVLLICLTSNLMLVQPETSDILKMKLSVSNAVTLQ